MIPKRRIAKRWTDEQIAGFANEPAITLADQLAFRLGGAIAAFWYAKRDEAKAEDETALDAGESVDLGQPGASLPE